MENNVVAVESPSCYFVDNLISDLFQYLYIAFLTKLLTSYGSLCNYLSVRAIAAKLGNSKSLQNITIFVA